jgi:hypothetical protein
VYEVAFVPTVVPPLVDAEVFEYHWYENDEPPAAVAATVNAVAAALGQYVAVAEEGCVLIVVFIPVPLAATFAEVAPVLETTMFPL